MTRKRFESPQGTIEWENELADSIKAYWHAQGKLVRTWLALVDGADRMYSLRSDMRNGLPVG